MTGEHRRMWGDNEVTNVFSAHLHCPCPEPKPRIPPFPPRLFARAAGKACDLTPGVFIKQLFAFLSFLFFLFFYDDADTDGDASVSLRCKGSLFTYDLACSNWRNGALQSFILLE